jgi:hypothetical protein
VRSALKRWLLVSAAAAVLGGAPSAAAPLSAASGDPFSTLAGRPREAKPQADVVARYVATGDGRAFLFQDGRADGRIKFVCAEADPRLDCRLDPGQPAEEIFMLTKTRGPRGDAIFRDGAGEVRLRLSPYGGATVFWPGESAGQAASMAEELAGSLDLPPADFAAAERRANEAAAHLSLLIGKTIVLDVKAGARDPDASVLADAVVRAASGMATVASDGTGAKILGARLSRAQLVPGAKPGLTLDGSTLTIVYDPKGGVSGRAPARAVADFLEENL